MDEQELKILDRVRSHLLTQGCKSLGVNGDCQYRTYGDAADARPVLKCAIGCLISDSAYNPYMEGATMSTVRPAAGRWQGNGYHGDHLARALNASGVPATRRIQMLLGSLQEIHDSNRVTSWPILLSIESIEERLAICDEQESIDGEWGIGVDVTFVD